MNGEFPESDSMITAAVESVMAIVGERGSVLLWGDIEKAAKCDKYSGSWGTIVRKVRERLIDERMQATWSERGVGLRLLTHSETVTEIPRKRQRRMFRQAGRAIKEMATADPNHLSLTERRLLNSQIERLENERKSLRSAQKEILGAMQFLPMRKPGTDFPDLSQPEDARTVNI